MAEISPYATTTDKASIYQGDVFDDIPLLFLPDKFSQWFILRPNLKGNMTIDDVLGGQMPKWFHSSPPSQLADCWSYSKEEYVAAKAKLMRVILLTQTCDLVQRSTYQVAPLFPFSTVPESKHDSLRSNDITYLFSRPKYGDAIPEECFVDLSAMSPVPKRYFRPEAVQARLSTMSVRQLQMHIAEFYGRPFGFNIRDRSPYSAEFACERCFYDALRITKVPVHEGQYFPPCKFCGDNAAWIRVTDAVQVPMEFPPIR